MAVKSRSEARIIRHKRIRKKNLWNSRKTKACIL